MQQPFSFALPKTDWKLPDLSKLPPWKDAKRIGFDLETRDPDLRTLGPGCRRDPKTNYVVGVAVAIVVKHEECVGYHAARNGADYYGNVYFGGLQIVGRRHTDDKLLAIAEKVMSIS